LQGTYPSTDYFDLTKQYTIGGFVIRQPILETDFNASALDWGLQGIYPSTDYFDLNKQYTNNGFVIRQPILETDFNAPALDWGLKGAYPSTDYFDLNKQYTIGGFVIRQPFKQTDFSATALDYSLINIPPLESGIASATTVTISGKTYAQVNFFDASFVNTNKGFHVFATPREQTAYNVNSSTLFSVPVSDFELARLGSPNYTLGSQLIKSPIFENAGFDSNRQNNNTYSELIRSRNYVSFLGDTATRNIPPSLIDIQYEKYSLKDESFNSSISLLSRQPFITRGIQTKGVVKNERWGFNTNLPDDGLIRGGAVTVADRTVADVARLTSWSASTRGLLYITKQIGLQLSNPNTETVNAINPTKIYQPTSPILAAASNALGIHPPRHGLIPFLISGRYEDTIKAKIANNENRIIDTANELSLLNRNIVDGVQPAAIPNGIAIRTLSGLTGPNSVYGIGVTNISRNSVSIPQNSFQKFTIKYQYASAFSNSNTKGIDQLVGIRENADSSGTASALRSIYMAFSGNAALLALGKTNTNATDKHILNLGVDGTSDSVKYIKSLNNSMPSIYLSNVDMRSVHTVRNPIPYSFDGDGDSLSLGAWSKDRNVNRPFIAELEQYGIISKRLKGFYAPEKITIGKNVTDTRTSLRLYNTGYEDSPTVSSANRAKIGPLSQRAQEDRQAGKLKISRLYDLMLEYANKYKSPVDIFNAEFQNISSYDDDDNIDIKYYVKNFLNPLNKITDGPDSGYLNINRRVNTATATTPEIYYKPNSLSEYAAIAYTDIPGNYVDSARRNVSVESTTNTIISSNLDTPSGLPWGSATYQTPQVSSVPSPEFRSETQVQLKNLNSPRFHDFRYKVHSFTQDENENVYPKKSGRVNFVTNPEIIKYRKNNLEDAAGFGKHGLPGVDRTNPVLSFLCGRVSQGVRSINGEQYGGEYLFRGDRVNLVDFRHDKSTTDINEIYELGENSLIPGKKDLIEFYVTGTGKKDRVIVFRATIKEVSDTFTPSWETVKYLNRADPAYLYRSFERDVSLTFEIGITSRDELRTRWRSINALAGFTAPEYITSPDETFNGRMKAPLMKLTLGNMYRATPCIITNLNYTFDNSETTWETAKLTRWVDGRELQETITTSDLDDPACCVALQLPKLIKVTMNLKIIGNYRPQSNGGTNGYPDMGIFYQLYASDDANNDGQLPRKGGVYVNYFNRECTIVKLPEPTPTPAVVEIEPPPSPIIKKSDIPTPPPTVPVEITPPDEPEIKKGSNTLKTRQGPSSKPKPSRTNNDGSTSKIDIQTITQPDRIGYTLTPTIPF